MMAGESFYGPFGPVTEPVIDTTVYPTVASLQKFLIAADVLSDPLPLEANNLPWQTWVSQAIREWERETNRKPFLARDDEDTIPYEADYSGTRVLDFRGGFVSVSLIEVSGREMLPDRDYTLMPVTAPVSDEPYEYVKFRQYVAGIVEVTGHRGYCQELPADVYSAILGRAAMLALPQLPNSLPSMDIGGQSGVVSRVKQADVEYQLDSGKDLRADKARLWQSTWEGAVEHYKLVTIV